MGVTRFIIFVIDSLETLSKFIFSKLLLIGNQKQLVIANDGDPKISWFLIKNLFDFYRIINNATEAKKNDEKNLYKKLKTNNWSQTNA